MAKNYAGKQSFIRPTLIKEERGYLGPYKWTLKVGDMQYMTFQPSDVGPFHLSEAIVDGKVMKQKITKSELIEKLELKASQRVECKKTYNNCV